MRTGQALLLLLVGCTLITSCSDPLRLDRYDPELNLEREDYLNMTGKDRQVSSEAPIPDAVPVVPAMQLGQPEIALTTKGAAPPPIPDLAEIIAAPKPPKIGTTKVVSIAVTDDVPLKDVLIELSKLADVDMEIDSSIVGGITFRAKDRPFNEVIDRISDMAGLRYSMKNNVLRVERDVPYIQTYALDMLNIDRASKANIGTGNTTGGSGGSSGSSEGGSSGSSGSSGGTGSSSSGSSSSSITAQSKGDFWEKFEEGVKQIVSYRSNSISSGVPDVVNTGVASNAGGASNGFYTINRQAGTLTFSGTERQQEIMQQFIKSIESNIAAQVLIEAKIVEVTLNDRYQTGINWTRLGGDSLSFAGDLSSVAPATSALTSGTITLLKNDVLRTGVDLSAAVSLLDEFGTTRALSSPRLNAMNNQQAVLSFTENLLYFQVEMEVTDPVKDANGVVTTPAKLEITSTPKTAPVGIQLAIQPSINVETSEITLSVRPTLTKVTKFITDPGFQIVKAIAAAQVSDPDVLAALSSADSKVPQLEVRELDSILKVKSGQVMVIGGLLEDIVSNLDSGVPGVDEIPYFGNLFKAVDKSNVKKELAILIRATVVPSTGLVPQGDIDLYNNFTKDPRPLNFR